MQKLMPTTIFGEPVVVGDNIIYITGDHGYTTLNWAEVMDIRTVKKPYNDYESFTMVCRKYNEKNGWRRWKSGKEMTVYLTQPKLLLVGSTIPENK